MIKRTALLLASAIALAACGGGDDDSEAPASQPRTEVDEDAPAPCDFVDGQVATITGPDASCLRPDGVIQVYGGHLCQDGRYLHSLDHPRGWYFGGDTFHAVDGDIAADPGYSAAYTECQA